MNKGPETEGHNQFHFNSSREERLKSLNTANCKPKTRGYFSQNKGLGFLIINLVLLGALGSFALSRIWAIEEGNFAGYIWRLSAVRTEDQIFLSLKGQPSQGALEGQIRVKFLLEGQMVQSQEVLLGNPPQELVLRTSLKGVGSEVVALLEWENQSFKLESTID